MQCFGRLYGAYLGHTFIKCILPALQYDSFLANSETFCQFNENVKFYLISLWRFNFSLSALSMDKESVEEPGQQCLLKVIAGQQLLVSSLSG
jgi:hypothetical protein